MNGGRRVQAGAALIVALLLLVVLAVLGVSAIGTSTVNMRIIFNTQTQQDTEAAAQAAIEQAISSISFFNTPMARTITVDGLDVAVGAAECLEWRKAKGYSENFSLAPEVTRWELVAEVDDATTGSQARLTQGVSIAMPAGYCVPLEDEDEDEDEDPDLSNTVEN